MCGICGIFRFDQKPVSPEVLKRMRDTMIHRGPDDSGLYQEKNFGFAHQRLSIVDLSMAGHQPMWNGNNTRSICYNGEIYGYQDIKKYLLSKGYRFSSRTDTEVILLGFEEFGEDFVHQMNGMFAFALWDSEKSELLLYRDRLGIKPLYLYMDHEKLIFASEIKAILASGEVNVGINPDSLSTYLSLRYCPGKETMFQNIVKLDPGSYLKVNQHGVKQQKYWDLLNFNETQPLSAGEAAEKFYSLLEDSVRKRLEADVPVGSFLSGGIDSATVTALMAKNTESGVNAFTFSFGLHDDESEKARIISDYIGVHHHLVKLEKSGYEQYSKAIWHLEEPLGDSIIVPTMLLAQEAVKKVKVVQLGEGADEILGGYVHQLALTYGDKFLKYVPTSFLPITAKLIKAIPTNIVEPFFPYPAKLGKSGVVKLSEFVKTFDSFSKSYLSLTGVFSEVEKELLLEKEVYSNQKKNGASDIFSDYMARSRNPDFLNRLSLLDLRYWNTDYTMLRMDKLTMAASLEARVPFLDHRLIELCVTIPRHFKTKRFKQKLLIRKAVEKHAVIPKEVVSRKKKAFFLPIEKCFDERFKQFVFDNLSSSKFRGRHIFNSQSVTNLINKKEKELIHNKQIMSVLLFELWCQNFMDTNPASTVKGGAMYP